MCVVGEMVGVRDGGGGGGGERGLDIEHGNG